MTPEERLERFVRQAIHSFDSGGLDDEMAIFRKAIETATYEDAAKIAEGLNDDCDYGDLDLLGAHIAAAIRARIQGGEL